MTTTSERRHQRIIGLQCDCWAESRDLLANSTIRKNAELRARVERIGRAARQANILCCTEWFSHELDRPAA